MFAGLNFVELRRFRRSRMGNLAIIAICAIPLLYSTLYLWSFWDPFDKLDRVPVAFVNDDQGVVLEGQHINAGDQIEEKIRHNDQLDWLLTNRQDALKGVHSGKYYFAVLLPKNFSEEVASPTGSTPQRATVDTYYNDLNGWLGSLIGQNAMRIFLDTVSSEIGKQGVDQVLVGLQEAGQGFQKATVGAKQLADGTVKLNDGTMQLHKASLRLDDGAKRLSKGSDELAAGTQQLHDEIDGLVKTLAVLTDPIHSSHRQAKELSQLQGSSSQQLMAIAATLRNSPDPQAKAAARQIEVLAKKLQAEGVGPSSDLMKELDHLNGVASDLDHGKLPGKMSKLTNGVDRLNDGAHQLSGGLAILSDGTGQLVVGVNQLYAGTSQLSAGANELYTKLAEGAKAIPNWSDAHRTKVADVLSRPVTLANHTGGHERTFGGGLAPFFFCLALYIGGIITFLLFNPLHPRAVAFGLKPMRVALDGFSSAAFIAVIQALVVVLVTNLVVPLDPATILGLIGFTILVGLVFMAMNQMLVVLLGPGPGRVATMALLMIQILASGGLYPVETEPIIWKWLHPILPMSYAVNGFRQVMYGNYDGRLVQAIVLLAVFLVIFLSMTALGARRDRTFTMEKLHPPISI